MRQRQTEAATESRALKMKFYCGLELLPGFNKMINEILVMKHMKRWMLIPRELMWNTLELLNAN
jgi:hypothetical protein